MFLLHLTYASGLHQILTFESAFLRALHMIALTAQPVEMSTEDVTVNR